jgi:hypothetical protein
MAIMAIMITVAARPFVAHETKPISQSLRELAERGDNQAARGQTKMVMTYEPAIVSSWFLLLRIRFKSIGKGVLFRCMRTCGPAPICQFLSMSVPVTHCLCQQLLVFCFQPRNVNGHSCTNCWSNCCSHTCSKIVRRVVRQADGGIKRDRFRCLAADCNHLEQY